MLYHEDPNHDFLPWNGEVIGNQKHPLSIEFSWTSDELAAIGLYIPVETPVPTGKRVASKTVKRIGGVVKYVYVYENIPVGGPADHPLSDRQLRLGLVLSGFPLAAVQATIDSIPDPTQRIVAQIWWDRSTLIEWNHVMTQTLIAAVGLTTEQASAMWMAAKDLEA